MRIFLLLPFLILGCAHKHPVSCGINKAYIEECYALFDQILRIQAERKTLSDEMQKNTRDFGDGKLSNEDHARLSHHWLMTENSLATQVTRLYTTTREKGCFNEEVNEHFAH